MEKNEILRLFGVEDAVKLSAVNSGHINSTLLAECKNGGKYILQSLSRDVFHDPEAVMGNIAAIRKAFDRSGDKSVAVPEYLLTEQGKNFAECEGDIFRVYRYTESEPFSKEHLYKAGYSFGAFIRILSGKNTRVKPTIQNFHSFSSYFEALKTAEKTSKLKKIDVSVMSRLGSVCEAADHVFTVDFPKRNVHNDAKIDNIVFGEPCTVIDLDTTMEGYAAIDYGDMIRSVCTGEVLSLTAVKVITEGFAQGVCGILTEDEIYSLYYGILYVTGELAVRYLIDYLSEEKYFKGKSSGDCLRRANSLLNQLNLFISHGEDITSIIYKAFKKQ